MIGKDCQTAPYPKHDEMAGDHGHYEPSTFWQCQPWLRNKVARCVDKDITTVGKADTKSKIA